MITLQTVAPCIFEIHKISKSETCFVSTITNFHWFSYIGYIIVTEALLKVLMNAKFSFSRSSALYNTFNTFLQDLQQTTVWKSYCLKAYLQSNHSTMILMQASSNMQLFITQNTGPPRRECLHLHFCLSHTINLIHMNKTCTLLSLWTDRHTALTTQEKESLILFHKQFICSTLNYASSTWSQTMSKANISYKPHKKEHSEQSLSPSNHNHQTSYTTKQRLFQYSPNSIQLALISLQQHQTSNHTITLTTNIY